VAEPGDRAPIEARLGGFDTAMVVVSLVIGIGIFRTPAIVAQQAGSEALFHAAWILGGLISLMGALTFAEIGSRHPRAGGYYRVVADAYHPMLAFMLNWAQALMQGAGAAGVAFIGADYLLPLLGPIGAGLSPLAVACALMLALLALNALGIRVGSRTQNVLSLLKILLIAGLAGAALLLAPRAAAPPAAAVAAGSHYALLGALIPVFYAYGGYHMTMNLGADVRDARRRLPLAITGGMLVVVALYLAINLGYVRALGLEGVAGSELVAAALARASFGPAGATVVSLAIFLSAAGFVNATILQMPRSYYAMAQDGVLPRMFLKVDPRTQAQPAGLWFFGLTMLVPAFMLGSFEQLLNYIIFTDAITLVVVASTLFVLRHRGSGGEGSFRVPLYPLLPALYLLCLAAAAAWILATQTRLAVAGLLLLATGAPLYALGRRINR
jgi:APA family basic amino acid/polyamine antiporter